MNLGVDATPGGGGVNNPPTTTYAGRCDVRDNYPNLPLECRLWVSFVN